MRRERIIIDRSLSVVRSTFKLHPDRQIILNARLSKSIHDARAMEMAFARQNIQKLTLSSTRVNIEKNNFLRDYFNSISFFFFCITVGYPYINILHEVSLFIYIISGGGLRGRGGGEGEEEDGKIRTKSSSCDNETFGFFFLSFFFYDL